MNAVEPYAIGYIRNSYVAGAFMDSVVGVLLNDNRAIHMEVQEGGPVLCQLRNKLVISFMTTSIPWLLMVDSDMTFPQNVFDLLRKDAAPDVVVSALYFKFASPRQPVNGRGHRVALPLIMHKSQDGSLDMVTNWREGEVIPASETGCGCMLIHRNVFDQTPFPWFTQDPEGKWDDANGFCRNFQAAGIRLMINTGVVAGHIKAIAVDQYDWGACRSDWLAEHHAQKISC